MESNIRQRRDAIRLQQQHLAVLCGIRPETLSRIETGKNPVPGYLNTILRLLERDETAVRFLMCEHGLIECSEQRRESR